MKLRVAACQILNTPSLAKSTDKIIGWMKQAAKQGASIVSFPECSINGFPTREYWTKNRGKAFIKAEKRVARAAARLKIAVVMGTARWEKGAIYNDILVIDKDGGTVGRYSKHYLAGDTWFSPGTTLPLLTVCGVRACFIICHDIRFPELVRLPAYRGAQVCFVCSSECGLTAEHKMSAFRAMPIARAAENMIYVVQANPPADPKNVTSHSQSHGNSKIIDPHGNILVEANHFEERLVMADIDTRLAKRTYALKAVERPGQMHEWMKQGIRLVSGGKISGVK